MDMQAGDRSDGREMGSPTMTVEVAEESVRRTLDLLRRNGHGRLYVEFFGGEPLLNWPVIRHVLTTFGNQPEAGIDIVYSITTNGSLVDESIAQMFKRYGVTVTVSVDLPGRVTGLPMVMAKSGDRVQAALTLLQATGNAVTLNAVISTETIDHFDGRRLIAFAREHGIGVIGLILDLNLAFYRVPSNRARVLDILLDTHRAGGQAGVRVSGYWHQIFDQITGEQPINLRSGYKTCPATGVKLSVEPDGSVQACKCTSGSLGRVTDLDRVLQSDRYASYAMDAYRHAPECEGCPIEGFCSGVCMGSFENEFERHNMIETGACDIFRGITKALIRDMPVETMSRLPLDGYAV
jgi:uncharacterized protein